MHDAFMARTIELAIENVRSRKGGPFAAIVVLDGKVVAQGTNLVTSTNDPTAHAEVVAIREACRRLGHYQLSRCDIYSTGEPCPMCVGAIYWARPARVFYANSIADAAKAGFDDEVIGEELLLPPANRRIPMLQIMNDLGRRVFEEWEKLDGRVEY